MLKIGQLCKTYNISRSTLLYYDSIDLLKPAIRTESNYRLYSKDDSLKLEKICNFRKAGIPLNEIKEILEPENTAYTKILMGRFDQITSQIETLKKQQASIAKMLKNKKFVKTSELITKETWNKLMSLTGFGESDSKKWHISFEQISPFEHTIFLESLGFSKKEIDKIKSWAK